MVEERFQKKRSSCKGKLLSTGGRLVLIDSVLSSVPMFMMSFSRNWTTIDIASFGNAMNKKEI